MSFGNWRPFCLGLDVLMAHIVRGQITSAIPCLSCYITEQNRGDVHSLLCFCSNWPHCGISSRGWLRQHARVGRMPHECMRMCHSTTIVLFRARKHTMCTIFEAELFHPSTKVTKFHVCVILLVDHVVMRGGGMISQKVSV